MTQRLLTVTIYALSALLGLAAFLYPFLLPELAEPTTLTQVTRATGEAPLLTVLLLLLSVAVLLLEVQGQAISAKVVASLGVLVAVAAVLRFVEVAIPGPGGFSPIFVPIILVGYVFGARLGFLMGTLTLLVSALITGGVGPWLPYQMFAAGWTGLTAGWLPRPQKPRLILAVLAVWGVVWGVAYGVILNLYFWPFLATDAAAAWQPGSSLLDGLRAYGTFYVATSLVWDLARAAGNVLLLVVLGLPTVRALVRFRDRFYFEVRPA